MLYVETVSVESCKSKDKFFYLSKNLEGNERREGECLGAIV